MAARSTLERSAEFYLQITSGTAKVRMVYSDEFKIAYCRMILEKMEASQTVNIAQKQQFCEDHIENFQRPASTPSLDRILRRFWDNREARAYLTTEELARYAALAASQNRILEAEPMSVDSLPLLPPVPLFVQNPIDSGERPAHASTPIFLLLNLFCAAQDVQPSLPAALTLLSNGTGSLLIPLFSCR